MIGKIPFFFFNFFNKFSLYSFSSTHQTKFFLKFEKDYDNFEFDNFGKTITNKGGGMGGGGGEGGMIDNTLIGLDLGYEGYQLGQDSTMVNEAVSDVGEFGSNTIKGAGNTLTNVGEMGGDTIEGIGNTLDDLEPKMCCFCFDCNCDGGCTNCWCLNFDNCNCLGDFSCTECDSSACKCLEFCGNVLECLEPVLACLKGTFECIGCVLSLFDEYKFQKKTFYY
ncbi:hypothetical protein M0812_20637 [Anaeramoeba flamelloides]|uniref:Uncharacterized protein n=1 Tax=Anaeramoeba flamelloides TaxID=1746091 RepID=A0AAV7YVG6_9EUKA|nr:hypothetical protein M0812_20637 [Anaeramoeba flamelloides]